MSRSRNLADLLDGNGDVKASGLDNVPPSNDASALTTGTLPISRIADGDITATKLNSTLDLSGKTVAYGLTTGDMPEGTVLQVVSRNFQANEATATNSSFGSTPESIIDNYQTELQVIDENSKILIIMGIHLHARRDGPANALGTIGFDFDSNSGVTKSASNYNSLVGGYGLYQNRKALGYDDLPANWGTSSGGVMTHLHTHGKSAGTYLYYTALTRTGYTNANASYTYYVQNGYNTITLMEIK
jgi:hypothetical protein